MSRFYLVKLVYLISLVILYKDMSLIVRLVVTLLRGFLLDIISIVETPRLITYLT